MRKKKLLDHVKNIREGKIEQTNGEFAPRFISGLYNMLEPFFHVNG